MAGKINSAALAAVEAILFLFENVDIVFLHEK